MKKVAVFLTGVAILAATCLIPVRSEALLVVSTTVGTQPAVFDTVSQRYWYYYAYQIPDNTTPSTPVSTIADYYTQSTSIGNLVIANQGASSVYNWHMASRGDFDALLSSAAGVVDYTLNPALAFATVINGFHNTGSVDVGDNTYNTVRWSGTPTQDPGAQDVSQYNILSDDVFLGSIFPGSISDGASSYLGINSIGAFAVSNAIPEPGTYLLLFIALSVIAGLRLVRERGKKLATCRQATS
jgi:hypothetical protein